MDRKSLNCCFHDKLLESISLPGLRLHIFAQIRIQAIGVNLNEVLLELSKVYEIHLGDKRKLSEIPDKVIKLAESLELNLFPIKLRS